MAREEFDPSVPRRSRVIQDDGTVVWTHHLIGSRNPAVKEHGILQARTKADGRITNREDHWAERPDFTSDDVEETRNRPDINAK